MDFWILFSSINAIILGYFLLYYFSARTILLLGLDGSGKTRFWRSMVGLNCTQTFTSLKSNVQTLKGVTWIDIPGHEKLWSLELSKSKIKGQLIIYFFINSKTFGKNRKKVAMRLYQSCRILSKYKARVRVKVTMDDDPLALEKDKIKILLEKE